MNGSYELGRCSQAIDRLGFAKKFAYAQEAIRKDPYRIGLPGVTLGSQYPLAPLPFQSEYWVLERENTFRGRIAASLSFTHPKRGYIGFFEATDFSNSEPLVQEAVQWLKEKGAEEIFGPVNWNTWFSYRFRTDTHELRFPFEPTNPPEYPVWFREMGFEEVETYHTDGMGNLESLVGGTEKSYERASESKYIFRPFERSLLEAYEIPKIYEISMVSFKDNFLFEPIPLDLFKDLYIPAMKQLDLKYSYFICDPTGKEVGFLFNFPLGEFFVMKTFALLPEARGLGLSNAALHISAKAAYQNGYRTSVGALIRDGIQSESYTRKQSHLWKHTYSLYRKGL